MEAIMAEPLITEDQLAQLLANGARTVCARVCGDERRPAARPAPARSNSRLLVPMSRLPALSSRSLDPE